MFWYTRNALVSIFSRCRQLFQQKGSDKQTCTLPDQQHIDAAEHVAAEEPDIRVRKDGIPMYTSTSEGVINIMLCLELVRLQPISPKTSMNWNVIYQRTNSVIANGRQ